MLKWARENGCDMTHTASTADGSCEDVVHDVFMGPQGEDEVERTLGGLFTRGQVQQAIESLVNDGFLYFTVENAEPLFYRSTDFFLKFGL